MNEILNYFVKSLAAKSLTLQKKSILMDRPWAMIDNNGEIQKIIFKRDKGLILSKNGKVTEGTWDYYPEARALLIDRNTDKLLLKEQYIDDNVLILKKDGTDNDFFALANENTLHDYNIPRYLNSLNCIEFKIQEVKLLNGHILQIHNGKNISLLYGAKGLKVNQLDSSLNSIDTNDGTYFSEDKKYLFNIQNSKISSVNKISLRKIANGDIIEIQDGNDTSVYNNIGKRITINGNPLFDKRILDNSNLILDIRESRIAQILVHKEYELKNGTNIIIEQKKYNKISRWDRIISPTTFLPDGQYKIKGKFKKIKVRNNIII